MTFNRVQKEIMAVIVSKNGIRWVPLKKMIVDEKRICSERVFRENLNELVKSGTVFKREITRQFVEYYVLKEIEDIERSFKEWYKKNYSQLEFVIKSIKKNRKKIPVTDQAGLIAILWKILSNFSLLTLTVVLVHKKPNLTKNMDLQPLMDELLGLFSQTKRDDEVELYDFVSRLITFDTYKLADVVKKELSDKKIPYS